MSTDSLSMTAEDGTFVTGDPAVNFSKNRGTANGPNNGVALRHSLAAVFKH